MKEEIIFLIIVLVITVLFPLSGYLYSQYKKDLMEEYKKERLEKDK